MLSDSSVGLLFTVKAKNETEKTFSDIKKDIKESGDAAENAGGGFGSLSGKVGELSEGFSAIAATVAVAVAGIVAVGTAAYQAGQFLFNLAKEASDAGSLIKDFQDKTGLAAETIGTLKFQAAQSGIALDSLQAPITKFTKLIFEASIGSEKAQKILAQIGVTNFDDFDDSLSKAISALHNTKNEIEQTGLASELFGAKTGSVMKAVADNVNGNLNKAIADAKRLGITLSQEDVDAADKFGDTYALLGTQIKSTSAKIALQYVPQITEAMNTLSESVAKNKDEFIFWGGVIGDILRGLPKVAEQGVGFFSGLVDDLNDSIKLLSLGTIDAIGLLNVLSLGQNAEFSQQLEQYKNQAALLKTQSDLNKATAAAFTTEKRGAGMGVNISDQDTLNEDAKKAREKADKEREAALQKLLSNLQNINKEYVEAERIAFEKTQRENQELLDSGGQTFEQYKTKALASIADFQKKVKDLMSAGFDLAAQGKTGADYKLVQESYKNEKAKFDEEIIKQQADVDKKASGAAKKSAEEKFKLAEDTAKNAIEVNKAQNEALIAQNEDALRTQFQQTISYIDGERKITEAQYANQIKSAVEVAEYVASRKNASIQFEIDENKKLLANINITAEKRIEIQKKIDLLDAELKQQQVKNAEAVALAVQGEIDQYLKLRETIENADEAAQKPGVSVDDLTTPEDDPKAKDDIFAGWTKSWREFRKEIESSVGLGNIISGIADLAIGAMESMAGAVGQAVEGWALYGESIGTALRKALAAELAHIAGIATVKALYATALGFLRLAEWDLVGAGNAFLSAGLWAALAGVTALAARAIAPKQTAQGAFNNQSNQATGRSGNQGQVYSQYRDASILEIGRNNPSGIQPLRAEITLRLDKKGALEIFEDDVEVNGRMSKLIVKVASERM